MLQVEPRQLGCRRILYGGGGRHDPALQLSGNALAPVEPGRLAKEDMIEGWIAEQPELLGLDRLLIIGRQVTTTYGGSIDLLGIDGEGDVVILEIKA